MAPQDSEWRGRRLSLRLAAGFLPNFFETRFFNFLLIWVQIFQNIHFESFFKSGFKSFSKMVTLELSWTKLGPLFDGTGSSNGSEIAGQRLLFPSDRRSGISQITRRRFALPDEVCGPSLTGILGCV